jgi:metal-responsive CopG/Arc/MetJ family transcriptional regulator
MRLTLSIPDAIAYRFQVVVPARQRSKLVCRLLEQNLAEREDLLALACRAANKDTKLDKETDEWQAFEDGVAE